MSRPYSTFGVFLSVIVLIFFTFLLWKLAGWWCVLLGPVVFVFAARPAREDGPWLWEKRDD